MSQLKSVKRLIMLKASFKAGASETILGTASLSQTFSFTILPSLHSLLLSQIVHGVPKFVPLGRVQLPRGNKKGRPNKLAVNLESSLT